MALVFDDRSRLSNGEPGYYVPYFLQGPLIEDDPRDYADEMAVVRNAKQDRSSCIRSLGSVVTALIDAGLTLNWLHEHDAIRWRMFDNLVEDRDRLRSRWPKEPYCLPLGYSLVTVWS